MAIDPETIAVYDARASEYQSRFDKSTDGPHLTAFLAELAPASDILDVGCGPGTDARAMMDKGHKVLAIDASSKMVTMARSAGVNARQETFDNIGGLGRFDGVWANFSLLHADRKDFPSCLAAIHATLRPRGAFHIGMKTGEAAQRDAIGRHYTYYREDELTGLLETAGFSVLAKSTGASAGLDGTVAPWIIVLCRRDG